MKLEYNVHRIYLKHTFSISRSSNNYYDILIIKIFEDDIIGIGEAAPNKRYNETINDIKSVLDKGLILPEHIIDRESTWNIIYPQLCGIKSLEAAFSIALWDWWGQKLKHPVHKLFNSRIDNLPPTSFTLAIGDLNDIGKKIEEAEPYSILKIKLGTPKQDKEIIKEVRRFTEKPIRVDANEGWGEESALDMCKWLADFNVELVEQPFPSTMLDSSHRLKAKSPLDIYADESSKSFCDLRSIKHAFDGINIKLMKCGSLEEAQKMINAAKSFNLKIMLGCMVETSIGITAAANLAGQVDCLDLDGNLLIKNDPFSGVQIRNGRLKLSSRSGLGLISSEILQGNKL